MQDDRIRDIAPKRTILENLVLHKFSKPVVIFFLLLIALCVSFLIARQGMVMGILIIGATIGAPLLYAAVAVPRVGIVIFIILSFFINYQLFLGQVPEDTPVGLVMDIMTYL